MPLVNSLFKNKEPLFFGWWIVLGSYVIQVLNGALLFHAFSAYILPLQAEFGWSRAAVSGVFSLVRAESGILGPLQGWAIDRYGPRAMMRAGIVLFAAGYLYFSRIDSLWGFYAAFAVETADHLAVGVARLGQGGIDAVLLDLVLPDSQEMATFERVKEVAPNTPVLVLTGLVDEDLAAEAVAAGACAYLVKTEIDGASLAQSIQSAVAD